MLLARPRSRSSLPHLRRLRRRDDVGLGGVAAFGTVLAAVLFSTLARAEPVSEVRVSEQPSLDVVVTIKGSRAPTFQIFRLPGQDAFAIELPGTDVSRASKDLGKHGVLLEESAVDVPARGAPRVVLRFYGDVDYDAKSDGSTLRVVFTPLGDKGALKRAWQARRTESDARSSAKKDLEDTTRKLEQQRQSYLAMVQEFEQQKAREKAALAEIEERVKQVRAGLANLEQRQGDEEKRLATLAKQREAAAAKAKAADEHTRRAEEEQERAALAVKQTQQELKRAQEELAKAKDSRALEEAKTELATVKKQLAASVEKRAAEERRAAELREAFEQTQKDLAALHAEQKKEQQALAAMKQRTSDEKARATAASEESDRVTQMLASLKEQQSFEHKRLDDMRRQVQRVAQEASTIEQRAQAQESQLAGLQRSVAEQQQALAQLGQQRQQMEQRLASLMRQASDAEARAHAADQHARVAMAHPAPAPRPTSQARVPAPRARPAPSGGRIEMASSESSPVYGFGGKSIDLSTPSGNNHYEQTDGYDDYSDSESLLSHVTVQRGDGGDSRVGVRVDGGARYTVERTSQREIVLTLFGTRAGNLDVRRILDARDLGTTVLRVLPRVLEGGDNRIELTIELRESAPVRVAQDSSMLWVHVGS